jgi:signal transduction histidine kinase
MPSRESRQSGGLSESRDLGQVQFSARDYGFGVPPRDIPKLFNRFVRLERDIAGSTRGTGVGLYMCRVLVEAMGGRIWVESRGISGEGSTFSFVLPAGPEGSLANAAQPSENLESS